MNALERFARLFGYPIPRPGISLAGMFPTLGMRSTRGRRRVRNAHPMRRRYRYAKKRPHRFSALEVADLRSFYMAEVNA